MGFVLSPVLKLEPQHGTLPHPNAEYGSLLEGYFGTWPARKRPAYQYEKLEVSISRTYELWSKLIKPSSPVIRIPKSL